MTVRSELERLSDHLRQAMATHNGDLELAVKAVIRVQPQSSDLLRQLLQGAQAAQDRETYDPEIALWLRKAAAMPRMRHLAATLQNLSPGQSTSLLGAISKRRPDLAEALKNALFAFDDLMYADSKGLQQLFASLPRSIILLSLRGLDDPLKAKILASLSARNRRDIVDELSWMQPARRSKIEEARRDVIAEARRRLERGEMFLRRPNDPDPYVD